MIQNEEKKQYKFFQTPKVLKKLDPYEWVLFTVLFDEWQMMKNEEEWFFRSENDLSEDTGLSPATIYRKTKSLEEKGLILVKRHSDGKTKSEKYKSNDYKINIETVISLAPIESHHRENESHQKDEPTNNIPTNKQYNTIENNKIYNINIKTSEDITPDDGTLQDDEVENVFLNNSDDDWLSYELKRSMMGEVNNDLKLNDMKKENEMSNKVAIEMNAISEQSERQARENESSESGTINKMTTSTSGDKNKTSKEFQNIPVINNDCNVQDVIPNAKDCAPAPSTEEWRPIAWDEDAIFGLGEPKTSEVEQLPTNEEKTRQEAQKYPQNETDVFKRISEILEEALVITDVEPFKAKLQEAIDLLKQVRPSANINAFTRCCNDTIYWFKNNNFDDLDIFFAASDFKRNIEQMKRA